MAFDLDMWYVFLLRFAHTVTEYWVLSQAPIHWYDIGNDIDAGGTCSNANTFPILILMMHSHSNNLPTLFKITYI